MKVIKGIAIAALFAASMVTLPSIAKADKFSCPGDINWSTIAYFEEPVQMGNLVLPAGSYMIQRNPSIYSSRVVMVYSLDRSRWEGVVLGVAAHRANIERMPAVTLENRGEGTPQAVRFLFYNDWSDGIEIPYANIKATEIARKLGSSPIKIASSAK